VGEGFKAPGSVVGERRVSVAAAVIGASAGGAAADGRGGGETETSGRAGGEADAVAAPDAEVETAKGGTLGGEREEERA
jgi:hypothetical protein